MKKPPAMLPVLVSVIVRTAPCEPTVVGAEVDRVGFRFELTARPPLPLSAALKVEPLA